jgi:hypothetical protein
VPRKSILPTFSPPPLAGGDYKWRWIQQKRQQREQQSMLPMRIRPKMKATDLAIADCSKTS